MRMPILGVSLAGVLAVLVLSCLSGFAQARGELEPGVHIDPGSPAAKQYALPLNEARQTGQHSSGATGSSGALFGAGIKPGSGPPKVRGSRLSPGNPETNAPTSANGGAAQPRRSVALPATVLRAEAAHASSDGNGSILVLLGAGVAILVLGGFVGMVLRRNRPSAPVH
jgi:hypothetical protein